MGFDAYTAQAFKDWGAVGLAVAVVTTTWAAGSTITPAASTAWSRSSASSLPLQQCAGTYVDSLYGKAVVAGGAARRNDASRSV